MWLTSTGAITSVYVGQPLDTVKVKMQTFPTMYKNGIDCFMKTLRQDGVARGLYAGTLPSLAANVSENAILFLFYGVCQKLVRIFFGANVLMNAIFLRFYGLYQKLVRILLFR